MFRPLLMICLLLGFFSARTIAQQSDSIVVNFAYKSATLSADADSVIDGYFIAAQGHFTLQALHLSGYCDNIGGATYNKTLSRQRALAVKAYLAGRWGDSLNIKSVEGYGLAYPLNENRTEQERSANRRVVIQVTKVAMTPSASASANPGASANPVVNATPAAAAEEEPAIAQMIDTASVGSSLVLKNINFYGGTHQPLDNSFPVIDQLLRTMKANPKLRIEIDGHICCIPSGEGYDSGTGTWDLSVRRARYIYDYLLEHGIEKHRMRYAGFGADHKLYPEDSAMGDAALNRRVEIKILAK